MRSSISLSICLLRSIALLNGIAQRVASSLIPHADSPVFYLLGDDPYGDNFLPLRLTGQHAVATLTGAGPVAMLYQINGSIVGQDPKRGATSPLLYHPYIDFSLPSPAYLAPLYPTDLTVPSPGECGPSGRLKFVQDTWLGSSFPSYENTFDNGIFDIDDPDYASNYLISPLDGKPIIGYPGGLAGIAQGFISSGRERVEKRNPCARFDGFALFSDRMDAQLGAKLIWGTNLTEFYACGNGRDIVYKSGLPDMPVDCVTPVQLFTFPVV